MNNGTVALDFLDYLEPTDSSQAFTSRIYNLKIGVRALAYQINWELGVAGTLYFEATILDDKWERIVDCEEIKISMTGAAEGHEIIVIPRVWLLARFVRFNWVPVGSSTGNINAGLRVLRI